MCKRQTDKGVLNIDATLLNPSEEMVCKLKKLTKQSVFNLLNLCGETY